MSFRDEIREQLKGLDNKQVCQFAWLCGVRALPFLGEERGFAYWPEKDKQKHLCSIFYALDTCAQAAFLDYFMDSKVRNKAKADNAYSQISKDSKARAKAVITTHSDAFDAVIAIESFAETAKTATYAIVNFTRAIKHIAYAVSSGQIEINYNASDAIISAVAELINAFRSNKDFQGILRKDFKAIKEKKLHECSHDISIYGKLWNNFQEDLKAISCDYWAELYEKLFKNGFDTLDQEELERRLSVPDEIKAEGVAVVVRYLEGLGDNKVERLNEARIIILGEKGAGKTSLARKLLDINAPMPKEDESTEGVETNTWTFKNKEGANVNVHVWDFAGHSITHSVHRCFMSARCLYIYVYNGRIERNNDPTYWLEQIRIHGGDSPILFLINEKDGHKADIAERTLKKDYPSIVDYYSVDIGSNDKTKLKEFRQTVMDAVCGNPSWNNQVVSKEAYEIMNVLCKYFDDTKYPHITLYAFNKIAQSCGVPKERIKGILEDLHTLGICLWYDKEEMEDFNMLVLNPDWITNGIYKIINEGFKEDKHILSVDKGTEILKNDKKYKYPRDKVAYLFKLMRLYELAFFKNTENIFIPGILPIDRPDSDKLSTFDDAKNRLMISFVVRKVLPLNIVIRIIVQFHEDIFDENLLWRKGAVLKYKSGDATALIIEDERSITVQVMGTNKTEYLTSLRETIKTIFEDYKVIKPDLLYQILIPKIHEKNTLEKETLMLSEKTINWYLQTEHPYFDPANKIKIPLQEIAKAYNINMNSMINIKSYNKIEINSDIEPKKQDKEDGEEDILSKLIEIYHNEENLTLVLGAGVSTPSKIVSWEGLIKKLLFEKIKEVFKVKGKLCSDDDINKIVEFALKKEFETPFAKMDHAAQMTYIREAYDLNYDLKDEDYNEIILNALYENNPEINTPLLKKIVQLCTKNKRGHSGINSIITYNFDDLLDRALEDNGVKKKTIYNGNDISSIGELNIYHVHGFLPNNKITSKDIHPVISEEDYYEIYKDVYHWSSIIQLDKFRETTCLFIGCSFNDPNLKRLLSAAKRPDEGIRHYAIMREINPEQNKNVNVENEAFEEYISLDTKIRKKLFHSLGINVIWVNDHKETPGILAKLL